MTGRTRQDGHGTPATSATPATPVTPPAHAHVPVMLERIIELLAPALDGPECVVVDCTLGMGGHAEALLERTPARLIGLDRDPEALRRTGSRLAPYTSRITLVQAVYDELPDVLGRLGIARVNGVLFDLGVSSLQLDDAQRGFSYVHNAPLDMRMDPTRGITAAEVVNTYSHGDLARILREFGEERFASKIAAAIVRERVREPFTNTVRLATLVKECIPAATRRTGGNPAKRTFQALRVEVNGELAALERALPAAVAALALGGRLVAMSYQSLEDRIVKRVLVAAATSTAPHDVPFVIEDQAPQLRLLTRGGEVPSADELEFNPRSASVRVRAAERIREAA